MTKRQRTTTQPFEQGVNPPGEPRPSRKRRAPSNNTRRSQSTPKRGGRKAAAERPRGLASPPPTAPRRRSPLFEPEAPEALTQSAVTEQAEELVDNEDDDIDEDEEDTLVPAPENEDDDEGDGRGVGVEVEFDYLQRPTPQLGSNESPGASGEPDPRVHIRWRACFGDMEKNAISAAYDSQRNVRFWGVDEHAVWDWVDGVVEELRPRQVNISSLCAVVYPPKQAKRDRSIKTLRRRRDGDWLSLCLLVNEIDSECGDLVHVDFDLLLSEMLNSAPAATPAAGGSRARPITATMIQEDGIASTLTAERAGSGHAIGLRDRWRCIDSYCKNHPYCCWLRPGQQARFENHLPVNGNIVAMWARDIHNRKATYDEPSDDVKLAILRAKDRADHEKSQRRRAPEEGGGDDIKSLTKLLIVGQLNQMNRQPLSELNLEQNAPNRLNSVALGPSGWLPFDYDHPAEIKCHTINFFDHLTSARPLDHEYIDQIFERIYVKGGMDINLIMGSPPEIDMVKMWVEHFKLSPGWYFVVKQHAIKWQQSYQGLSERDRRRVRRAQEREEKIRQTIGPERSSSVVSE